MEKSNHAYSSTALEQKEIELEQDIYNRQCILNRLKKTKEFYKYAGTMQGKFEIRDFPLFSVLKSFDDRCDISSYGDNILSKLDGEDILSSTVRAISLDRTGYKGSKICIIKKAAGECQDSQEKFLESGRSAYTAGFVDDLFDERIFHVVHKWLNEHGFKHKGIAYFIYRFMFCVLRRDV